ncbi:MAG: redoxin domain-containing protein [Methylomonas sp.]|nr:redoxin domain-containing protein [Methylomonas sp.]PPD19994.1 MAG: thiol-disulfide isomerase [Methylomonas sp.]PPD26534.1 MAG: thiol-disulfide isomerase [Methylomonas sp.]PPD36977.1 MAG: thiol-disulfide isomerase [Methylomonas sp.]PPD38280.1 MAG: thiol-disulfide isomerase [Methylomonas sp.]
MVSPIESAVIGHPAPDWDVADWVQGEASSLHDHRGRLVLVEVFQVNCPGCFLYALPQAIELDRRYRDQGLTVIGLATAFEDFDLNTLANLCLLAEHGQVVGASLQALQAQGVLQQGRWPHRIPFPLAMDRLVDTAFDGSDAAVDAFIATNLDGFVDLAADFQQTVRQRVRQHLQNQRYRSQTFERYRMQGTPTQLLIDADGVLRQSRFGHYPEVERDIVRWLPT